MITNPNLPEQGVSELLEEYFQSGYSIKDFCFLKETIEEATLHSLIQKHCPERALPDDDPFFDINIMVKEDRKNPGRPKKPHLAEPVLFARVVGEAIEIYRETSSNYLKSLRS